MRGEALPFRRRLLNSYAHWFEASLDSVFEPEYKLLSIDAMGEFVKAHGHLPTIPTGEVLFARTYRARAMGTACCYKLPAPTGLKERDRMAFFPYYLATLLSQQHANGAPSGYAILLTLPALFDKSGASKTKLTTVKHITARRLLKFHPALAACRYTTS
jgi:hypothetical protein